MTPTERRLALAAMLSMLTAGVALGAAWSPRQGPHHVVQLPVVGYAVATVSREHT